MEKLPCEMNRHEEPQKYKLYLRQILTAFGPLMGVVAAGMVSGYSGVLLPQLKSSSSLTAHNPYANDTDEIRVTTTEEESWIASSTVLPMGPGCWLSGYMMEKIGRKKSMILIFPMMLIGWFTVGLAGNFTCLIVGRVICGLCVGLLGPLVPVYISEASDPLLRGVLLAMISSAIATGVLVIHTIGTWTHWRLTIYTSSVLPVVGWLSCFAARESPSWLLHKGRAEESRKSWIYLRGERSMEEYFLLESTKIQESKNNAKKQRFVSTLRETLTSRHFLLPLGIMCLFFFTAQFAGTNVVVFYSVDMLADVAGPENAYRGSLLLDVIRLGTSVIACYLIKKYKARTLTFLSGFVSAVSLFTLSLSLYFQFGMPWLPAVCLVFYIIFLSFGLVPLPWMLCGELFPTKYRGLGSGFTSGFTFICFFVVVKTAPSMFETLQAYGTFAVYGVVTLIGISILYFSLPETSGKTLQEIEAYFDKKPAKWEAKNAEIPMLEQVSAEKPQMKLQEL